MEPLEGRIYWEELRPLIDHPGQGDSLFLLFYFSFLDTMCQWPKAIDRPDPTENSETMNQSKPAVFYLESLWYFATVMGNWLFLEPCNHLCPFLLLFESLARNSLLTWLLGHSFLLPPQPLLPEKFCTEGWSLDSPPGSIYFQNIHLVLCFVFFFLFTFETGSQYITFAVLEFAM